MLQKNPKKRITAKDAYQNYLWMIDEESVQTTSLK